MPSKSNAIHKQLHDNISKPDGTCLPDSGSHTSRNMQSIFYSPKILYFRERVLHYLENYNAINSARARNENGHITPITMEIDITNRCTHRCPYCVGRRLPDCSDEQLYETSGNGDQMTVSSASDYIRQMVSAGVVGLIFTGGGEPTVHPDLVTLVALASNLGLKVGLITHGGLLHKHDMERLVLSCEWIRVSVDASNADEYKIIHGRDDKEWERLWNNLWQLVSAKKRLTAKGYDELATLGTAYLVGPENSEGIADFAAMAGAVGVDYAQIRPFYRYINFNLGDTLATIQKKLNSETFQVVGSLQKYSQLHNGIVSPRSYCYCHLAEFASVICANGKMYVCCHLRNVSDSCIGDLNRNSFEEILRSEERIRANANVDVSKCLELCRGDHVNRLIQRYIDEDIIPEPIKVVPKHVGFL
ncbi:MAG: radical SAM/SPASM domain-containing protein [Candidatus Zixiibacteriota bacterium]